MIYRDALTSDGPALGAMARAAFVATFGALYPPEILTSYCEDTFGVGGLPAQIGHDAYRIRIALAGDRIVGFAKLGRSTLPPPARACDAELKQLYILADWHGQGVAAVLMDWALAMARGDGARRMVLSVWVGNHRARRFYERYGFAEIGRNPFRVGTQIDDDRIWMLEL